MKRLAFAAIATLALAGFAGVAEAASAYTTRALNLYSAATSRSGLIATVPAGEYVRVGGCTSGYVYCDVSWAGYRGWARASGLSYRHAGYQHFPSAAVALGIPLIAGTLIFKHHHGHPPIFNGVPSYHWQPKPWVGGPSIPGPFINGSGGQGN